MQWYVYPLATFATVFLGFILFELFGRPIRSLLRLRRTALERLRLSQRLMLPKPRELAVTSQAIHEHDLAVRNRRAAESMFCDLGMRLLALGESEPTVRILLNFFGFNVVLAGHAVIRLSQVYAAATIDSKENRQAIARAIQESRIALGACRPQSRGDLTNIRLEPIHLREVPYRQSRKRPGRPPMPSRHAARSPFPVRQPLRPTMVNSR